VLEGERLAQGETASKTDVTILPLGIGGSLVLDTVATALCQLVTTYGHVTRQTLFWEPLPDGSLRALQRMDATSLPAYGSVMAKQITCMYMALHTVTQTEGHHMQPSGSRMHKKCAGGVEVAADIGSGQRVPLARLVCPSCAAERSIRQPPPSV